MQNNTFCLEKWFGKKKTLYEKESIMKKVCTKIRIDVFEKLGCHQISSLIKINLIKT